MSLLFKCRKIQKDDLEMIMNWRMSPEVTKFMNTDPILTLESQEKWFDAISQEENFFYWIIEVNTMPCGVINLTDIDRKNKHCTWGYYVVEKLLRSFQLSISLEMSLYDYVFDILNFNKITAESFSDNVAATKMHDLCGCVEEGILKDHIFKNGQFYDIYIQSMFAEKWKNIKETFQYVKINFE